MRSTNHCSKFKAVEFKFFLPNVAPIFLKGIVSDEVYKHLLPVTAIRYMCEKEQMDKIDIIRKFLIKFVTEASEIYGKSFLSINVRNLVHICDDIETTKLSLLEISAFSFEYYLGSISKRLRSPTHL